jgi:hypothetical protein
MCKLKKYNATSNTQIDICMRPLIKWMKEKEICYPVACCCGHGKYPMSVVVECVDGFFELFSNIDIPRKRKFYKKDKEGYYFIPEVAREINPSKARRT